MHCVRLCSPVYWQHWSPTHKHTVPENVPTLEAKIIKVHTHTCITHQLMQLVQQFPHNFSYNRPFDTFLALLSHFVYFPGCQLNRTWRTPTGLLQFLSVIVKSTLKLKLPIASWSFYVSEFVCESFLNQQLIDCCRYLHSSFWAERIMVDWNTTGRCLVLLTVAPNSRD